MKIDLDGHDPFLHEDSEEEIELFEKDRYSEITQFATMFAFHGRLILSFRGQT